MKIILILLAASLVFPSVYAESAIVGDINGDGNIDTSEAIYALQVAAGLYPEVNTSCLLSGKGAWSTSTEYVECDVVLSGGENYVCNTSHPSSDDVFGDDTANWDLLSLKGDTGPAGTSSWTDGTEVVSTTKNVDIAGSIKISNDSSICNASNAGTIRWSGANFEGCTGSAWVSLRMGRVKTVTSGGRLWMDRNLGASRVATSSSDSAAYGDLYQWGRLTDGHERRVSPTIQSQSEGDVPGHGFFISGFSEWQAIQNNNLWQGSGLNNPCPAGFRLPIETEWEAERQSWDPNNNTAGAFASPLKLVAAGYRSYSDGKVYDAGNSGNYWSSTLDGSSSPRYLLFSSSDAFMFMTFSTFGFSVRCIKN